MRSSGCLSPPDTISKDVCAWSRALPILMAVFGIWVGAALRNVQSAGPLATDGPAFPDLARVYLLMD